MEILCPSEELPAGRAGLFGCYTVRRVTPGLSRDYSRCNNDIAQEFQQVVACRYTSYTCYTAIEEVEHRPRSHAIYFMIVVAAHGRNRMG